MMTDKRRVLMTGFGVVAQALLPMLVERLKMDAKQITVIDFEDRRRLLRPWIKKGLRFVQERVTQLNLARLLATHVDQGGLIIDLAWSIDCFEILRWAHHHDVLYVNASVESWGPESSSRSMVERSLYARYVRLVEATSTWGSGPTAVIDHGANPGLVSHFVKQGLVDLASAALRTGRIPRPQHPRIEALVADNAFASLAQALGVRVIHCSEWDSQRASVAKPPDEFVGTWSVQGCWDEAISPSEIGWGTHEKQLPAHAVVPEHGPRNQIILRQMGLNTWVRSWVPDQEIVGMVVTHGESFTISHALTVREDGVPVYRPTVHYAYLACNDTMASLHELRCRNYELHPRKRILGDEIEAGMDLVGALIMGHPLQSWWTGSQLTIDQARRHMSRVNATAVQVAAGVLAAVKWMLRNPRKGFCLPEDLPHEEILRDARPYLGRLLSVESDWTPLARRRNGYDHNPAYRSESGDPWQFGSFLFKP